MGDFIDIISAIRSWRIWTAIAKDDVIGRYRRTALGPFWMVLAQGGFILGIYLLHRQAFGADQANFLIYLAAGLPCWGLVVGMLTEGSSALIRAKDYIQSYPLPPAIFIIRMVASNLVAFAHTIVIYFVTALILRHPLNLVAFGFIPGLLLVTAFGLGATLILGPIGARFRDIPLAINSLTGMLFVLTPIFWIPNATERSSLLVRGNPLYYLLEVIRDPLLGSMPSLNVWIAALVVSLGTLLAGSAVYVSSRAQLIYWL